MLIMLIIVYIVYTSYVYFFVCFAFHLCMYYVCIMCVPIRMYCYTLYCYNWLRCNHTSFPPTPCVGLRIFTLFFRPLRSVSYREKIVSSLCSVDLRMTFLFFSFFFFLRNKLNFDSYSFDLILEIGNCIYTSWKISKWRKLREREKKKEVSAEIIASR